MDPSSRLAALNVPGGTAMTGTAGGGGGDGAGPTPVRTVADRPRGRVSIGTVCARRMGTLARRDSPWVLPGVELRSPAAPLMRSGVTGNPRDNGKCRRATAATTCGLSGESMEATDLPSTSLPSLWADRREAAAVGGDRLVDMLDSAAQNENSRARDASTAITPLLRRSRPAWCAPSSSRAAGEAPDDAVDANMRCRRCT